MSQSLSIPRPILAMTLSGSIFPITRSLRDLERLKRVMQDLRLLRERYDLVVVVGGGNKARVYQHLAKACGLSDSVLDWIGVDITKINAEIIWRALDRLLPEPWKCPVTIEDAITLFHKKRFLVTGGMIPGQTTDTVIVDLAIGLGLPKIYKLSNFDRLYMVDPITERKHYFSQVSYERLLRYFEGQAEHVPGQHFPFDLKALHRLQAHRIELEILHFKHLNQLLNHERSVQSTVIDHR